MEQLPVFEKYRDPRVAETEARALQKAGIAIQLENDSGQLHELVYPMDVLSAHYLLRMHARDFAAARNALERHYENEIQKIDDDYMLYQFTDKELIDVVLKADEWGPLNKVLALHILEERGIPIHSSVVEGIQKDRHEKIKEPEKFDSVWIIIGYAMALFGGLLGIVIGWYLDSSRKTLPDGTRIYQFTPEDRRHGRRIIVVGIVAFAASMALRLFSR